MVPNHVFLLRADDGPVLLPINGHVLPFEVLHWCIPGEDVGQEEGVLCGPVGPSDSVGTCRILAGGQRGFSVSHSSISLEMPF